MSKPKSETQRKTDSKIRSVLADVCKNFLNDVAGFQTLTHEADYSNFPASLLITCVFDTDINQREALANGSATNIQRHTQAKLLKIGVKVKAPKQQIIFNAQECRNEP